MSEPTRDELIQYVFKEVQNSMPSMLAYSLAGSTATSVLCGMAFVLAGMYFRRFKTDRWWWKAIVAAEMVFALAQLALIVTMTGYEVVRIHDRDKLGKVMIWDFVSIVGRCVHDLQHQISHLSIGMAGAVNLGLTQVFLFYRCWRLSGRRIWVGIVGGLSVLNIFAWIIAFGTSIGMFTPLFKGPEEPVKDLSAWQVFTCFEIFKTHQYRVISRGFLLSATLTEWVMSGLLIYNLSRYQTSFRSSRKIVSQTMVLAVQSAIPSTIVFTIEMIMVFRNDYHNYLVRPFMYFAGVINLLIVLATLHSRSRLRMIARGGPDQAAQHDAMIAEALQRAAEIPVTMENGDVVASLAVRSGGGRVGGSPVGLTEEEKDLSDDLKTVSFEDMFSDAHFPPSRSPILGPGMTGNRSWHDPVASVPPIRPGQLQRDPLASE